MNSVAERFHQLASGPVRPLDWDLAVSWTKARNEDVAWFTLNQSQLNGADLLAEDNDNPIQIWDAYEYHKIRDRVINLNIERSVEFPYNIQSAVCDFTLNNYDRYFSIDNDRSPIAGYIMPARPVRAYLGFKTAGVTPVFVGLTEGIPSYSGTHNTTAQLSALDFLATIGDMSMRNMVMMRDVRTDEVISAILEQFGLRPEMYKLGKGLNVIPFVFFESGKNAGNALKELVQAENGTMWVDEAGIIRFEPRTQLLGQDSVMSLDASSIISISASQNSGIINRVYVESDVRKVGEYQQIFSVENEKGFEAETADDAYRIKANGTTTIWLNFDDPIWEGNAAPSLNGALDDSSFTAVTLAGEKVNGGISADGTFFADSLKLEFKNTTKQPMSLTFLQIWGKPAKVLGESPTIKYTAEDEESIEKFGVQELSIMDNNCFGNQQNIDAFAQDILERYADYSPTITMEIKGDPALQIQDIVTINGTDYEGDWLVKGITQSLQEARLTTKITAVRHIIQYPFVLNKSVLDGPDLLG